jgi:YidC/Oxa1 family membrane protein insertase
MERGSITKWLLLGLAIFLFMQFGPKAIWGNKGSPHQPRIEDETSAEGVAPEERCSIAGPRFKAVLSTRGASLRHLDLDDYTGPSTMPSDTLGSILHLFTGDAKGSQGPADLVSTSRAGRSPLRVDLRMPAGDTGAQQVPYDDLDWKLAASDGKSCTFTYEDAQTSLTKVVSAGAEPFELSVDVTVHNLSKAPRKHRFAVEQTAYHTKKEMEGHLGRQSELVTKAVAITSVKSEFEHSGDFEPGNFVKPEFTPEHWRRTPGDAKLAAVSSVYFTKVLLPGGEGPAPAAETLIEEVWHYDRYGDNKEADPSYGDVFRARLVYPERELGPDQTAHYRVVSFTGPKEREALGRIDRGPELLEFGLGWFAFATKDIARGLVWYLLKLQRVVKSWGWAIVLLTISVRILLFPLSLSQIKNSAAMRKLKPEMDAINEKYKDDAAQRGLAIQELWRKNGVTNPVVGCLPMLLQMPVWWALYTALQTAVELYHVPFGPVIPDLSAPGRYLIIPLVLGASSFLQQKLMPAQGDPAQQKMMMYMMPAIFTFMMLFLPAGLGVYMVTNSVLAIAQQLLVERYLKAHAGPTGQIEVREKTSGTGGKPPPAPALGKGKARARG